MVCNNLGGRYEINIPFPTRSLRPLMPVTVSKSNTYFLQQLSSSAVSFQPSPDESAILHFFITDIGIEDHRILSVVDHLLTDHTLLDILL